MALLALVIGLAVFYGLFRLAIAGAARLRGTRFASVLEGERKQGTSRIRVGAGSLASWTVTVNEDQGVAGGSIKLGDSRGGRIAGALTAAVLAISVPAVSGTMLCAALIALAVGQLRRLVRPTALRPDRPQVPAA